MELIDLVKSKVKDTAGKLDDPTDFENSIAQALNAYSKVRPRRVVDDIPGNGTNDLDLPELWNDDFSTIESIEFPIGTVPETLLCLDDFKIYRTPDGPKLRLLNTKPAADDTLRLLFTRLHVEESVPQADLEAVADKAASLCCLQIAAASGGNMTSTIAADSVDYKSETDQYRRLSGEFEARYRDHLGIGKDAPVKAASATAAPPSGSGSRTRLTHRGR